MLKRDLGSDKLGGTVAADKHLPIFPTSFSPAVFYITGLCFRSYKKGLLSTWHGKGIKSLLASEEPLDLNVPLTLNDRNILLVEQAPTKHLPEPGSQGPQDLICSKTFFQTCLKLMFPQADLFLRSLSKLYWGEELQHCRPRHVIPQSTGRRASRGLLCHLQDIRLSARTKSIYLQPDLSAVEQLLLK